MRVANVGQIRVDAADTYDNTGVVTSLGAVSDGLTPTLPMTVPEPRTESAPVIDRVEGGKTRVGGLVDGSVELRSRRVGGTVLVSTPDTRVVADGVP